MADNEVTTSAIALEPVRVDVRSVEKELAELWRKAAEGGMPGVSAPASRVLLSNILVYAANEAEAAEASTVVQQIAAKHPARTIIADAEPGPRENELDADVSMLCNITELGRRLCGEEVRLHAHGVTVTALGTILPVIVPDLPVYLWTPGEIKPDDPVFPQLLNIPDHWIVDSRRFENLAAGLEMIEHLGLSEPEVVVHDLTWASLGVWREVVARHFDQKPARDYLPGITTVDITCCRSGAETPVEALLLAGWLVAQLGWRDPVVKQQSDDVMVIEADSANGRVTITLSASKEARSGLGRVVISSEVDGRTACFSSTISSETRGVTIEATAPELPQVRTTVVMNLLSTSQELLQVLDAPEREAVYEKAVKVVRQVLDGR